MDEEKETLNKIVIIQKLLAVQLFTTYMYIDINSKVAQN